jgi:hypothetical protein
VPLAPGHHVAVPPSNKRPRLGLGGWRGQARPLVPPGRRDVVIRDFHRRRLGAAGEGGLLPHLHDHFRPRLRRGRRLLRLNHGRRPPRLRHPRLRPGGRCHRPRPLASPRLPLPPRRRPPATPSKSAAWLGWTHPPSAPWPVRGGARLAPPYGHGNKPSSSRLTGTRPLER